MSLFLKSTYLSAALSLVYIFALYRSHPYRRIPSAPTLLAFVLGMVAVVPVVAVRRAIPLPSIETSALALVGAAAIEEGSKFLLAFVSIWRYRFPNVAEPFDFGVYFGVLGVGFGIYEDFWYIFSVTYPSWVAGDVGRFNEVFRGITLARAFPGHILFNGIAGVLLGFAFFAEGRRRAAWIAGSVVVAIALHVGFNGIAIVGESPLLIAYLVLLVGVFLGMRRRLKERSPFAALVRRVEGADERWRFEHRPLEYLFADGFDWPGSRGGGLFQFYPIVLSLAVLFPLLLIGVYFLNRAVVLGAAG